MGATGAGKSTIVNLIERFYDTTSGTVKFDGVDVKDISLKQLRSNISVVMQDVFLFSDSIEENIKMGRRDEILQDQMFLQFMAEVGGMQPDQSGQFIDMQTGQPVPPDFIMQAYQEFQMQMQQQQQQQQQEQGDQMPDYGYQPVQPEQMPPQNQAGGAMPSEVLDQIQTMLDSTLQAYTASIEKRLEAFNDKLDAVKTAIESIGNKDDQRQPADKDEAEMLRQELASELQPTVKTAAVKPASKPAFSAPKPINMFDMLINKR